MVVVSVVLRVIVGFGMAWGQFSVLVVKFVIVVLEISNWGNFASLLLSGWLVVVNSSKFAWLFGSFISVSIKAGCVKSSCVDGLCFIIVEVVLINESICLFLKPTSTLGGSNDGQEDDSGCDLADELLKGESLLGLSLVHGNTSCSSRLCLFVLLKHSDDCTVGLGGLLHQEDS